jgi:Flp pilus assembly protein CpaB
MNTARIVVLTIAVGAGGVAACLASGHDNQPLLTEPVAQRQSADALGQSELVACARQTGPLASDGKPSKGRTI